MKQPQTEKLSPDTHYSISKSQSFLRITHIFGMVGIERSYTGSQIA
jgi:hypothetical protein